MTAHSDLLYSLTGFVVGMLVGVTGVGGGSLMTPVLVLLFGFHPATAVGTDLLFASVTKTVGTAVHHKRKSVDWLIVARLASGSIPASLLTLWTMSRLGALGSKATAILNALIGAVLLLTSLAIFLRPQLLRWAATRPGSQVETTAAHSTILLGALLGVLVSVTSVGAGALGTTALLILYPRRPIVQIAASDVAHAVPLTLIAGIGHWLMGSVNVALMEALLTGSIPGVIAGSLLATRASDSVLRPTLGLIVLTVSVRLLAG